MLVLVSIKDKILSIDIEKAGVKSNTSFMEAVRGFNPNYKIKSEIELKEFASEESLRLFYVAVSRAKKYLNVLSFEPYTSVKPAEYIDNLACHLNH